MAGMAIGVMAGRGPLKGSCGGMGVEALRVEAGDWQGLEKLIDGGASRFIYCMSSIKT